MREDIVSTIPTRSEVSVVSASEPDDSFTQFDQIEATRSKATDRFWTRRPVTN